MNATSPPLSPRAGGLRSLCLQTFSCRRRAPSPAPHRKAPPPTPDPQVSLFTFQPPMPGDGPASLGSLLRPPQSAGPGLLCPGWSPVPGPHPSSPPPWSDVPVPPRFFPGSRVCDLGSPIRPCAQKGRMLSLMLSRNSEHSLDKGLSFSVFTGPTNFGAGPGHSWA